MVSVCSKGICIEPMGCEPSRDINPWHACESLLSQQNTKVLADTSVRAIRIENAVNKVVMKMGV